MPTGTPYFAWVEASETTFGAEHLRWDEKVFVFQLEQREGEFAALTIQVRNPRIGPLAPGRKVWAWFAFDCGNGNLKKFFGRLIGVPSNLIGEVITFEFVARPSDYETQLAALAESMKELPGYDPIFVDPQAASDPNIVLEGYSSRWHIDRETHAVTASDELIGEDGTLVFEPDDMLYDGLGMNITGSPASIAVIDAAFSWTQLATGTIDLTEYITSNWPNEVGLGVAPGLITSFTLSADNWPKTEATIGDRWTVASGWCQTLYNVTPRSRSETNKTIYRWANGSVTTLESSRSIESITIPGGSISFPEIVTRDESQVQYEDDGAGNREVVGFSRDYSDTSTVVPLIFLRPRLRAAYDASRPFAENVRVVVTSDVQPVLTEPEDGMVARLPGLKSVNLSETVGEGSDAEVPIGDPRRRSYIATARGQQSLRHILSIARATLRRQARVVEITIEPLLARMPEVTLRKSAFVTDARIPGGSAAGKIIGYSLGLDGDSGAVSCSLTIGCAVGRGGTVSEVAGTPEYCEEDYIAQSEDYQEYSGRVVLLDDEADLGFTLPLFNPNDDGLDFISGLSVGDVIEEGLTVTFPPATQRAFLGGAPYAGGFFGFLNASPERRQQVVQERSQALNAILQAVETVAHFKLRPMSGEFETSLEIEVTGLKVPQTIDLESAA